MTGGAWQYDIFARPANQQVAPVAIPRARPAASHDPSIIKEAWISLTITGISLSYASSGLKMFRPGFADENQARGFADSYNARPDREFTVRILGVQDYRPLGSNREAASQ